MIHPYLEVLICLACGWVSVFFLKRSPIFKCGVRLEKHCLRHIMLSILEPAQGQGAPLPQRQPVGDRVTAQVEGPAQSPLLLMLASRQQSAISRQTFEKFLTQVQTSRPPGTWGWVGSLPHASPSALRSSLPSHLSLLQANPARALNSPRTTQDTPHVLRIWFLLLLPSNRAVPPGAADCLTFTRLLCRFLESE